MDVASFCPFPVGVVRWRGPEPLITVVVKATFSLAADGVAELCAAQDPLSTDRPGAAGGLGYATDFVPRKARADVLVSGHAHAAAPQAAIPARFTVGEVQKSVLAVANQPATRIPLRGGFLRQGPAVESPLAVVGPRAFDAGRAPDGAVVAAEGPPRSPLPAGFDFSYFNAAPPDQQVAEIRADVALDLEGLLPGASRRRVALPGMRPLVYYFSGEATEVPLRCDTLHVDTDRAVVVLVFRGVIEPPPPHASLVVTLQTAAHRPAWANLASHLHAARRSQAVEANVGPAPAAKARPAVDFRATVAADPDAASAPAVPFQAAAPGVPPPPPAGARPASRSWIGSQTVAADLDEAPSPAVPFRAGPPSAAVTTPTPAVARPQAPSFARMTVASDDPAPTGPALPFPQVPPATEAWPAIPSARAVIAAPLPLPLAPAPVAAPPEVAPDLPRWAAPPAPPPAEAAPPALPARELSFAQYVAVMADLAAPDAGRGAVLARHDVDEATLSASQRRIDAELARDAEAGDSARILELGRAVEEARGRGRPVRQLSLAPEAYARVKAELEICADADAVLERHHLRPAEWEAFDRGTTASASTDSALRAELTAHLRAARRELALRRMRR